jgi:hypothetical protein
MNWSCRLKSALLRIKKIANITFSHYTFVIGVERIGWKLFGIGLTLLCPESSCGSGIYVRRFGASVEVTEEEFSREILS